MNQRRFVKRIFLAFIMAALSVWYALPVFAGDPVRVAVTIFPAYDWVMQILGDNPGNLEVTWLFDQGVDPHSYQPTVQDIMTIAASDLFIYTGGESDQWVDDALKGAVNPAQNVISLVDALGSDAREEEYVEGMQSEEEIPGIVAEPDEHVWLSLRNAEGFCNEIASALQTLDPDHSQTYRANADAYIEKLQALDQEYKQSIAASSGDILLFADRFPFRYLTDDYGLKYYAAFAGCSAETEASFETIVFLANKVDELKLPCVLVIDGSDGKIAQTIVQNTAGKDQKILTLNSLQSETHEDVLAGETYLSVMEDNLHVLEEALN